MAAAVNTHDQLRKAGGGVAITVATGGIRQTYVNGWYVYRLGADLRPIPTNPDAPWYDYGKKWFSNSDATGKTFHERQRNALESAKKWVAEQGWYDGEWVGNRDRCYVPKDINKRFPIRQAAPAPCARPRSGEGVGGEMATWNQYRMWRRVLGRWKATQITFRARSQPEAQRKTNKFWADAELGEGTMVCILDGTTPEEG